VCMCERGAALLECVRFECKHVSIVLSPPAAATLPRYVCVHVCVLRGWCVLVCALCIYVKVQTVSVLVVFMYVSHSSLENSVKSPITDDMCACECE